MKPSEAFNFWKELYLFYFCKKLRENEIAKYNMNFNKTGKISNKILIYFDIYLHVRANRVS